MSPMSPMNPTDPVDGTASAPTRLTLTQLTGALRHSAGFDGGAELDAGTLDVAFTDLGYDSVALLETCAHIERRHGIKLDDSTIENATTPRALLAVINARLAAGHADGRTP